MGGSWTNLPPFLPLVREVDNTPPLPGWVVGSDGPWTDTPPPHVDRQTPGKILSCLMLRTWSVINEIYMVGEGYLELKIHHKLPDRKGTLDTLSLASFGNIFRAGSLTLSMHLTDIYRNSMLACTSMKHYRSLCQGSRSVNGNIHDTSMLKVIMLLHSTHFV